MGHIPSQDVSCWEWSYGEMWSFTKPEPKTQRVVQIITSILNWPGNGVVASATVVTARNYRDPVTCPSPSVASAF